jgi:mono/diheme cytochrome c family protein
VSHRPGMSRRPLLALAALGTVMLLAAGCGAVAKVTSGNPASGKALFVAKCGSCHTLANAGTQGTIGPDLDAAFASVKQQGFEVSSVVDVVRGQIAYPDERAGTVCVNGPKTKAGKGLKCTSSQGMPANIVSGQDAKNVAVYVGFCSEILNEKTGEMHPDPSCTTKNQTVKVPS